MFSINDFRSELNKNDVLHGNRFIVEIGPDRAREFGPEGPDNLITVESDSWDTPEVRTILSLKAESVNLPGMFFASADGLPPRFGYGITESIPYAATFDPVTINFAIDGKAKVYKFFYYWTNSIVNYRAKGQNTRKDTGDKLQTYEVQYKDDYVRDIHIKVYKPFHRPERGEYLMDIKLYRAFPRALPPNQMAWEEQNGYMKFPVTFDYTDFEIKFKKK